MKRSIQCLVALAWICSLSAVSGCQDREPEFGDGTYHIGIISDKVSKSYALFGDSAAHGAMNVTNWLEKGDYAYVVGEEGIQDIGKKYPLQFFLIDLTSNKLTVYKKLADVSEPHRAIFQSLLKTKKKP